MVTRLTVGNAPIIIPSSLIALFTQTFLLTMQRRLEQRRVNERQRELAQAERECFGERSFMASAMTTNSSDCCSSSHLLGALLHVIRTAGEEGRDLLGRLNYFAGAIMYGATNGEPQLAAVGIRDYITERHHIRVRTSIILGHVRTIVGDPAPIDNGASWLAFYFRYYGRFPLSDDDWSSDETANGINPQQDRSDSEQSI
jgi:hypothetical protein